MPPDSLAAADAGAVDSVAADSVTAGAAPDAPEARPMPPRLEGAASQTRPGVTLPGDDWWVCSTARCRRGNTGF